MRGVCSEPTKQERFVRQSACARSDGSEGEENLLYYQSTQIISRVSMRSKRGSKSYLQLEVCSDDKRAIHVNTSHLLSE
jgi:hypothetical protein